MDNKTNEMRNIVNDLFEEWEIIRVKMDSIPPSPADLADEEIMSELDSIDEIRKQANLVGDGNMRQQLFAEAISGATRLRCKLQLMFVKCYNFLTSAVRTEEKNYYAMNALRCFAYIMDCIYIACDCYAVMKMNDACNYCLRALIEFVKKNRLDSHSVVGILSGNCCYRLLSEEDMSIISAIPEQVNCAMSLIGRAVYLNGHKRF